MDPWYPLGSADMLEVAAMGLHVAQMTGRDGDARLLRRGHRQRGAHPAARRLRHRARAATPTSCCCRRATRSRRIRLRATRLKVFRAGRLVAESPAAVATLHLPDRPRSVDWTPDDRGGK